MTLNLAVGQNTNVVQLPQNLIAWHSRDSGGAITGITTETGFIRIDGIAIRNGYHYLFDVPQVNLTASATSIIGLCRLRFNLSGNATTASSLLPYGGFWRDNQNVDATTNTNVNGFRGMYHASADGTLSVLWSLVRISGSGSVGLFASAGNPATLFVYEMGLYPAVSGVDI